MFAFALRRARIDGSLSHYCLTDLAESARAADLCVAVGSPSFSEEMAARAHESTAVFVNADVVTMDERNPFAEAVAVRSGRIVAVGEVGRVLAAAGPARALFDLGGGTLVPGFIDGHGHFTQVAGELDWVDLSPPPAGRTAHDRRHDRRS